MIQAHNISERGLAEQDDQQSQGSGGQNVNVSDVERHLSIAGGAFLLVTGLPKLVFGHGLLRSIAGAALLYRGLSGHCALKSAFTHGSGQKNADEPSAEPAEYNRRSIHVEESITIAKPAEELYAFWHDFEVLPQIMGHLKEVRTIDEKRSHWVAKAPLGFSVEWDAEIINDEPNRLIAWRSIGNAQVDNSGSVRFIESGQEGVTEVRVVLDYIPPAGKLGSIVAKLFGEEPKQQVKDDLRRFKELMESGTESGAADSARKSS